jgi:hypothetical protein
MTHLDPDALAFAAMNEVDLTPSQRDHLAACPACSRELTALRRTVAVARSAATVELLQPADAVWGRIHDELGLSAAVAAPPRVEGAPSAGDAAETGDADRADGTDDTDGMDETDHTDEPGEPGEPVVEQGASVTPRTPRRLRSQGTLAFAAAAGLICLVGGIAGRARRQPRPRPPATVPLTA